MINPFLRSPPSIADRATELAERGVIVFLKSLLPLLKQGLPNATVIQNLFPGAVTKVNPETTSVSLSDGDAQLLRKVMEKARIAMPSDVIMGSKSEVLKKVNKVLFFVDPPLVTIGLLLGSAFLLWRGIKGGALSGYPAETARGAVYANNCDEAQRRFDMAWKALQEMEDRGDPNFMHEAKKVYKIARQVRENGCEVI